MAMKNVAHKIGCSGVLLALLCGAVEAHAQEPTPGAATPPPRAAAKDTAKGTDSEEKGPIPIALTVSGGVSLGAYQGGYLYYLTETAKRNPDLLDIRLVTGASAGMINSFLTLLALGQSESIAPEESLFFRVWNRMRYDELLDVDQAPPQALSSRAVLEQLAAEIEGVWNKGISEDVDMVLGAATTRLKGHSVEINEGFKVEKQQENFVFRVQGRGTGKEPIVSNYIDETYGLPQPLLPFGDPDRGNTRTGRTNFSVIRQILFASSAIPIVFLPQQIDYCMTAPDEVPGDLSAVLRDCPIPTHSEKFVDGAIVDRKPLRLAHRIARSGLVDVEAGQVAWRETPDLTNRILPDDVLFVYVDPSAPTYRQEMEDESGEEVLDQAERLFRTAGNLFKSIFSSTRGKELVTLVEEHPEVRKQLELARHDFPTMSGLILNFFGFFDRKIREFDFYLGMRDARRFVERVIIPRVKERQQQGAVTMTFPEPDPPRPQNQFGGSWRPYFCQRAVMDGQIEYQQACHSGELDDFRILLQATLDRLYDHCRRLPYDETIDNHHCKLAMSGASPPEVWRVYEDHEDIWRRQDDDNENEFEYTMRLLDAYQFHFQDLELDRDDARFATMRIREELLVLVDEFAKKLRFGERLAIRLIGKPAINFFVYAPPLAIFYLVMGKGAEFALSGTLRKSYWLRFNIALQVQGLNLFLTEKPNAFAMTPAAGLEAEIYPTSTPLLQTRIGVRMGYQFSTDDGFLSGSCNTRTFRNDSIRCSAPVGQAFLALVFYERIRLQVGVEWLPRWLPPMNRFDRHLWNGLIEVGWQWISPF